jgi:thiol-disulfide isomerase/thioredoxin
MLQHRKIFLTAGLLVLGCFLLTGSITAGDKKPEDKKVEKKAGDTKSAGEVASKTVSRFNAKAIELKLKNDMVSYPGELTDADATLQNHYYKVFTVVLEKGKTYRIDHKDRGGDPKFDAFLFLEDADGTQLDVNDDFAPPGLDSRIVYKIAKTGTYRLVATTLPPNQTGKFTLEIAPETDAKQLKEADLRFRINTLATLSKAQQKALAEEVGKRLLDADGDLTIADARLVIQLGMEAESEDVNLARSVYKDGVKYFSAAKDQRITGVTRQFEGTLKNLDKVGKAFEITGKTIDGKEFDLKDFKGKVVLIDFWGTWCPPCVAEIPNIVRNYEKYHGKGFEVIGVSSDKQDDVVVQFLKAKGVPWACINVEDSRKMIDLHEVNAYPTTVLVDQAGRIYSFRARGPQLERLLERLLAQKK